MTAAVQISVGSQGLWQRFCAGFGLDPQTRGMATNAERVGNRQQVIDLVEGAFAGYDAAELLPRLAELGVPAGRVRTLDEVYDWEQTRAQGLVVGVEHATLGPLQVPGPPLRFFTTAATGGGEDEVTRRRPPGAAGAGPARGEHPTLARPARGHRRRRAVTPGSAAPGHPRRRR